MRVGLLLVLLAYSSRIYAQYSQCVINTPKGTIDLNGLVNSNGYYLASPGSQWNYYINICALAKSFPDVSACPAAYQSKGYQVGVDQSSCFPMTDNGSNDISLSLIDSSNASKGAVLKYASFTYDNYARVTEITALCNPDSTTSVLQYKDEQYTPGGSLYTFTITSKYACPGATSSSMPLGQLGVGGLLIIILFSLLVLYFIVGALVSKFYLKKEGKEIIPHVYFWMDLPFLIKDGPLLFVDLIKKRKYSELA
jgi:hypothetical protein